MRVPRLIIIGLLLTVVTAAAEEVQYGEFDLPEPTLLSESHLFVKPWLALREEYTDNLFNTRDFRKWDLITAVTPGLRVGLPWEREIVPFLLVSNRTPGGLRALNLGQASGRVFESHLNLSKTFESYRNFPDEETDPQVLEGVAAFGLGERGEIQLIGVHTLGFEEFGTGLSRTQDPYESLLAGAAARLNFGEKLRVELWGQGYALDYDDAVNAERDRQDRVAGGRLGYRLSGKLRGFVEYQQSDLDYDAATSDDSVQQRLLGGIEWRITGKTWGMIKLGTEARDTEGQPQERDSVYEGRLSWRPTPKGVVHLLSSNGGEETDIAGTRNIRTLRHRLKYFHALTAKTSLQLQLSYVAEDYAGLFTYGGVVGQREDRRFQFGAGANWAVRRWALVRLAYLYEERDSNFDDFDYQTNRWLLELRVSL